ncbi:hypothetical protein PGT21_011699 [Puccinia graminis f. sp. tritici]|uniref:Uncharacterized protein n=1 Tax=Puccinia graminis f. sp. tritici TaxID=56615 RepID=A0A5B0NDF2_PUCGR|nr:hypothetical protein PGT21_011699 [Puccinia graminis f. sp. tritici]
MPAGLSHLLVASLMIINCSGIEDLLDDHELFSEWDIPTAEEVAHFLLSSPSPNHSHPTDGQDDLEVQAASGALGDARSVHAFCIPVVQSIENRPARHPVGPLQWQSEADKRQSRLLPHTDIPIPEAARKNLKRKHPQPSSPPNTRDSSSEMDSPVYAPLLFVREARARHLATRTGHSIACVAPSGFHGRTGHSIPCVAPSGFHGMMEQSGHWSPLFPLVASSISNRDLVNQEAKWFFQKSANSISEGPADPQDSLRIAEAGATADCMPYYAEPFDVFRFDGIMDQSSASSPALSPSTTSRVVNPAHQTGPSFPQTTADSMGSCGPKTHPPCARAPEKLVLNPQKLSSVAQAQSRQESRLERLVFDREVFNYPDSSLRNDPARKKILELLDLFSTRYSQEKLVMTEAQFATYHFNLTRATKPSHQQPQKETSEKTEGATNPDYVARFSTAQSIFLSNMELWIAHWQKIPDFECHRLVEWIHDSKTIRQRVLPCAYILFVEMISTIVPKSAEEEEDRSMGSELTLAFRIFETTSGPVGHRKRRSDSKQASVVQSNESRPHQPHISADSTMKAMLWRLLEVWLRASRKSFFEATQHHGRLSQSTKAFFNNIFCYSIEALTDRFRTK